MHKQNELLNNENKKLLNELRQMKVDVNRLTTASKRTVSRNEYNGTSNTCSTGRGNSMGRKKNSINKLTQVDQNQQKPKRNKVRQFVALLI